MHCTHLQNPGNKWGWEMQFLLYSRQNHKKQSHKYGCYLTVVWSLPHFWPTCVWLWDRWKTVVSLLHTLNFLLVDDTRSYWRVTACWLCVKSTCKIVSLMSQYFVYYSEVLWNTFPYATKTFELVDILNLRREELWRATFWRSVSLLLF